jgi:hypothetical protein
LGVALLESGNPVVQTDLYVGITHQRLVPDPVAALLALEQLDGHAIGGIKHQTASQQGVINT